MKVIDAAAIDTTAKTTRLQFIDNIRWAVIVLVIMHHAAVTYSHVGSWYYNEDPKPGLATTLLFATFLSFNQAYFMGFLFLIAGYFTPAAFDRKGFGAFLRDRWKRLGIPAAIYMLVIHPVIVYWLLRDFYQPSRPSLISAYPKFLASGRVLSASGPMWFALALLIFCLVYALFRAARAQTNPTRNDDAPLPNNRQVVALILFVAGVTFVVRIFQPSGTSVLNMQLANFSQYITLFVLGIVAYRRNWLGRIPFSFGISWMRFALIIALPLWAFVILLSGVLQGKPPTNILGGVHWGSAAYCLWESILCLGMSLGLLVLFRDRFHLQGALARFMSRNAFAAYMFHTPLLIAVTLALRPISAPYLIKWAIASAVAVPITFLASEFIFRRTPGLKQVL